MRTSLITKSNWWKPALGIVLGGLIGYGYYYFIGCAAGSCPIQSNAYLMTGYGVLFGLLFGIPSKKKSPKNKNKGD
ncbi:MAG TPA: hypothetical protein VJ951_15330 [Bacteroidales bacterium]|nr:hypothetical protein [Bacteroidales bacterium]